MSEQNPKNRLKAIKKGKTIKIEIETSSEEMADKFFDIIEILAIEGVRFDLEKEWTENE